MNEEEATLGLTQEERENALQRLIIIAERETYETRRQLKDALMLLHDANDLARKLMNRCLAAEERVDELL